LFIVDDEPSVRDMLAMALARPKLEVRTFSSAEAALKELDADGPDVVITDIQMPGMSGMDLLRALNEGNSATEVILITAFGSQELAIEALRRGAFDYVTKPFQIDELRLIVSRALERRRLMREARNLRAELGTRARARFGEVVGDSEVMVRVCEMLARFADSPATVLLVGESGTGKGVAARALHSQGPRAAREFISVNCGAIPESLIEAELFGAVKGAYTGLDHDRDGLVRAAEGGTLFLDEIGEMPAMAQVRLLQVLQDRVVRPVGSTAEIPVNVRVVAATNRVLEQEVQAGRFREDLYYRLNVVKIHLPPLRERRGDIPLLIRHFLNEFAERYERTEVSIQPEALTRMRLYDWPGNVRELMNVLERALLMSTGPQITAGDLGEPLQAFDTDDESGLLPLPAEGLNLDERLADIEGKYLKQALERTSGNRTEAARLLGMNLRSIRYRLKKLQDREASQDREDEG
jgi:two-component system response regulator PilR (NtrC family)